MKYRIHLLNPFELEDGSKRSYIDCNQYVNSNYGIHYHLDGNATVDQQPKITNFDGFGFVPTNNLVNIQPLEQ